ncbi:amino acid adenylation domain-containing protein [Clostridium sp. DSM 8431]|uniref:amino acid adenylation domain-containing protein n=1 Tax=Clostridium sp. DSM 8431 TaxID=1761781 RepID=UPI0008EA61E9|nr:amino acid adenylation domain-containing protein [Clostridium sp. DSM 8431]SFU64360.1 amino acid adenylation domain-containing protein [Clostridium sp. DSM 8431]
MNILVCTYDNVKYCLTKDGLNPSLVPYNGTVYLKELLELLIQKKTNKDNVFLFLSKKNSSISKLLEPYKEINIIYEENSYSVFKSLKKDCCMFIHSDKFFARSDIEKYIDYIEKNPAKNVVAKKIKHNNEKRLEGIFKFNSDIVAKLNEEDFKKLCSMEYNDKNQFLDMCDEFYLENPVIELENKNDFLKLYNTIEFPKEENIPALFRKAAKEYSHKIAVTYLDKTITYEELDCITDFVASELIKRKKLLNKNNVGILMDKSIEFIICMIGILKAGMTYIPMSKFYPDGRLKMIYESADLNCIITSSETSYYKQYPNECILYESLIEKEEINPQIYDVEIPSKSMAYIMFTSGSTGDPKGVRISHRNIINNAFFLHRKVFENKSFKPKNYGVIAEFVFDMSVQQIYPALLFGRNLNIFPSCCGKSAKNLIEFLNKVDTSDATPIILQIITDYIEIRKNEFSRDVHLVVGGEKLQHNLCKRYFAIKEKSEITNIYGPTECTVEISTFYLNKDIVEDLQEIPVGSAVYNSRVYVLDENNKFVMPNVVGEICAAGECIGHGYINSKSLSDKYYINDILSSSKMYKTGDYGFWNEDGELCFIGRKDRQVKVRGLRIDLGDIESTIETYSPIIETRVFVVNVEGLGEKIVSYFISKKQDITLSEIVNSIKEYLPAYMIPSFFVPVKTFPLNISGKLDKSKLPKLSTALKDRNEEELSYSEDDEIAQKVINYISENFAIFSYNQFDYSLGEIGCDSLNILSMITFLYENFNVELSISMISIQMKISELIALVKNNINEEKGNLKTRRYKKSYKCLPMQNYVIDVEYSNLMLYGESKNINTMIYLWNLNKDINCERLKKAILNAVENNDAFFMKFHYGENGSKVFYTDKSNIDVNFQELNNISKETIVNLIPELDFKNTPLAYFSIIKCGNEMYLLTAVHHLIFDYISGVSLMKTIEGYYNGEKCRFTSFFKNLEKFNKYKNSVDYNESKERLFELYSKTRRINFSDEFIDYKNEENKKIIKLNSNTSSRIRKISKKYFISEFLLYTAAFFRSLNLVVHQETMTIASFVNGRNNVVPANTIGFFSKYVPVTYIEKEYDLIKSAKHIEKDWLELQKLDSALEIYDVLNNMREPCNVLFDYQKMYSNEQNESIYRRVETYDLARVDLDFVFRLYDYKDYIEIRVEYKGINELFIERFIEEYEKQLGGINYE